MLSPREAHAQPANEEILVWGAVARTPLEA